MHSSYSFFFILLSISALHASEPSEGQAASSSSSSMGKRSIETQTNETRMGENSSTRLMELLSIKRGHEKLLKEVSAKIVKIRADDENKRSCMWDSGSVFYRIGAGETIPHDHPFRKIFQENGLITETEDNSRRYRLSDDIARAYKELELLKK